ncbi:unnamed protein product [Effrenium voratum]|uniref:ubiquitinyl hydrolase 1 n=1 Tax=Effrenium voratum TaxID=2562239 RepID=A0AA36HQI5_9DINO|nr:unnamed protein product [Effrenium voratum]
MDALRTLVQKVQDRAWRLETAERSACSVLPPLCPELTSQRPSPELLFDDFERLLEQDVEGMKGEVDPARVSISVPTSELPLAVRDPFEAAECCRLAVHLLTLLCNQFEHISQSALTRFALIARLLMQILPMPLPLDHPKASGCFWMQEMKQETKADLMRHLFLIARHFAAVCCTLRASRETDGARVVVSAAIAAIMDALLRRVLVGPLHGSLASRHYSGLAEGPCLPFGVDCGTFKAASATLLLVAPECQALRSLVLDYFDSVRRSISEDHVVFSFDQQMTCGEGDTAWVEQMGLCLGLDSARREAACLLTGERPELLELFPEIAWFRDTVFLWKMLLLPACQCPPMQQWRAADSLLKWQYKKGRFEVVGFGMTLTAEAQRPSFFQGVLRWFGQYESDNKSLSRASPSVLAGSQEINTEDDVLFLNQLPTFNGALGAADSELLLTYLTAPYLRIPLLLSFFTDRQRVSALREPQLQVVLDAVLFEPGPWQSRLEAHQAPPELVPAPERRHLSTAAGLLFNELMRAPQPVLHAVLCLLQVAVEKDVGRPDSANEGLILYIIRLAVRVESYLAFLLAPGRRGEGSCGFLVRSLAVPEDTSLLEELEASQGRLRRELQGDVLRMLSDWLRYAAKRPDKLLPAACRVHAHIALIFTNVPAAELGVHEAAGFLSAQAFLNINFRWAEAGG